MKKILISAFALLLLTLSLCGCNRAIIYEEETAIQTWLKEKTQGYTQCTPSSRMILTHQKDGFQIRLDTGSDMVAKLTVENDATNQTVQERNLLTVTGPGGLFAAADHANRVFDPYRNSYTRALQVWQKDETTFRIFFWLYGEDTDFYPIPKLLTQDQYRRVLDMVETYNGEKALESEAAGEKIINYTGDFLNLYQAIYVSDKATNPNGTVYYEHTGAATEHAAIYREMFSRLGLTEQDWRRSFQKLGYTGQKLNLQILYCDLTVGESTVTMTLHTDDGYTSSLLASQNLPLTYSFCPAFASRPDIILNVK